VLSGNGSVTCTSKRGFTGTATFSYAIADTYGVTAAGTVTINVTR
jgi:hypothetical protein